MTQKIAQTDGGKEKMSITKKKTEDTVNYDVEVKRAKQFESGDIAVDMVVNGISIYNCTYKSGEKDGKEYAFISFPARKSSDGKYYNHVYFKISDELLADIEKQIEKLI